MHLWYVKEYRPDRMLIHLKTKQGKSIFFPPGKTPPVSPKTIILVVLLITSTVVLYITLPFHILIKMFIIDALTFPISFLLVVILRIPTLLFHAYMIKLGTSMLRSHKPMIVIGVTGSFGKTSTKEYLASILSKKYKVLKTEASKNSPIGIAEVILKKLKADHEVFIVEMGAYKRGEVARMTAMVRPQIGIVTAINAQHQDLFGSLDTTMRAKYELLTGLTGKKIAICNADNPYTLKMAKWAKADGKKVWFFSNKRTVPVKNDALLSFSSVSSTIHDVSFTVTLKNQSYPVKVQMRGEHFVPNLMAALSGAVASGMSLREAVAIAKKTIEPVERVMELLKGPNGQQFINDTFNNNPDAAIAALRYMEKFPGRKILVFQPMIELGKYTFEGHFEVGKVAGKLCDEMILTNSNFTEGFKKGVEESDRKKQVRILGSGEAAAFIKSHSKKNDTVLFKGKEAAFVLKLL